MNWPVVATQGTDRALWMREAYKACNMGGTDSVREPGEPMKRQHW
jgi:hypothetical protein